MIPPELSPKIDYFIATGSMGAWWWLPHFDQIMHVLLGLGGVTLLVIRIFAAWKEYKAKKNGK